MTIREATHNLYEEIKHLFGQGLSGTGEGSDTIYIYYEKKIHRRLFEKYENGYEGFPVKLVRVGIIKAN